MVLLVKCTRRCVKEEEGSGEKASIYMILAPTLVSRATPTCHTPVDHRYNNGAHFVKGECNGDVSYNEVRSRKCGL